MELSRPRFATVVVEFPHNGIDKVIAAVAGNRSVCCTGDIDASAVHGDATGDVGSELPGPDFVACCSVISQKAGSGTKDPWDCLMSSHDVYIRGVHGHA